VKTFIDNHCCESKKILRAITQNKKTNYIDFQDKEKHLSITAASKRKFSERVDIKLHEAFGMWKNHAASKKVSIYARKLRGAV
jgi:predicted HicB family RNase H-like nuclease